MEDVKVAMLDDGAVFSFPDAGEIKVVVDVDGLVIQVDGVRLAKVDLSRQSEDFEAEFPEEEVRPCLLIYGSPHEDGNEPVGHVDYLGEGTKITVPSGACIYRRIYATGGGAHVMVEKKD